MHCTQILNETQNVAPSGLREGDELRDPATYEPFGIVTKTTRKRTGHVTVWYRNAKKDVVFMDLPKVVKQVKISKRCQDCNGDGCAPCDYSGHQARRIV
jgi:hypothetical protein